MKTATHTSKCGKWLYKRSVKHEDPIPAYTLAGKLSRRMQFYDVHCGKWRESVMLECDLVCLQKP